MCGRFTRHTPAKLIATLFDATVHGGDLRPPYNVAPTQLVMAVRQRDDARQVVALMWGLIPSWAKDPKIGSRQINARAETVATKPAFRAAFKARRCLVVADGFVEWQPGGKVSSRSSSTGRITSPSASPACGSNGIRTAR